MTDTKKTTARRNVLKGTAAAAAGVVAAPSAPSVGEAVGADRERWAQSCSALRVML